MSKQLEMKLKLLGRDSWSRPVYENEEGKLFVDTDPIPGTPIGLCTKSSNEFDGEPETPIEYTKYCEYKIVVNKRDTWY